MTAQPDHAPAPRLLPLALKATLAAFALALLVVSLSAPDAAVLIHLLARKFAGPLCAAALIVCAAAAAGHWALRLGRIYPGRGAEGLLCSFAVGSCLLSLAMLGAGVCGLMQRWAVTVVLLALAVGWLADRPWRGIAGDSPGCSGWPRAWFALAVLLLGVNALAAFLPPCEYDVLEYHLGAPAQYHQAGRISFLKDNVYSNFPSNAEMTYLLGMVLTGDRLAGAYAGKLVNVVYGLAIAAFVALAARQVFRGASSGGPALALYACPLILTAGMLAHVTMALMLYLALAVYALLRWLTADGPKRPRRWLVLCALGIGAAMGTKYTAFLLVLTPLALVVVVCEIGGWRRRATAAIALLLPAVVLASPWLVRNAANTGNPTYPLLCTVFDSPNWSDVKDARFAAAHSPASLSVREFAVRVREFVANGHKVYVCAAVVMLALASLLHLAHREAVLPVAALACIWVLMCLLWYGFTHQIDRFLAPSIVVLGFLGAAGAAALDRGLAGRILLRLAVGVFCTLSLVQNLVLARNAGVFAGALMFDDNPKSVAEFMQDHTDFGEVWEMFRYADETLPADSKILFVGEARPFYCPRPAWAGTVFDDAPLETVLRAGSVSGALAVLRDAGVTHLLFNTREIRRLRTTYAFPFAGQQCPGYLLLTPDQARVMAELKRKHLKLIEAVGKEYDSGVRHVELYRVQFAP